MYILKTAGRRAKQMKIQDAQGNFRARSFEFILGSFGALCKISDVKIFKTLLLPQFSFNFNQTLQKACIRENTGYYTCSICQILKVHGALKRSYLSYIASIHKLSWFLLAKGQAERQGTWASCSWTCLGCGVSASVFQPSSFGRVHLKFKLAQISSHLNMWARMQEISDASRTLQQLIFTTLPLQFRPQPTRCSYAIDRFVQEVAQTLNLTNTENHQTEKEGFLLKKWNS